MSTAQRIIRPEIQALAAYHVSDASGLIKLDVMESPYRLPGWLANRGGPAVSARRVSQGLRDLGRRRRS